MAMHTTRMTKDENFSLHFDGLKNNGSVAQKNKGGIGGRKALNDISNSKKPSALQPSRKHNTNQTRAPANGRKVLGDVTNSIKPSLQHHQGLKKKIPSIAEEGFLHNHEECIKQQKKSMDLDFHEFLKIAGLDKDDCPHTLLSPEKPKNENVTMMFEVEEIPVPVIEVRSPRTRGGQAASSSSSSSPVCGSVESPFKSMMDYDDDYLRFELTESPEKSKVV